MWLSCMTDLGSKAVLETKGKNHNIQEPPDGKLSHQVVLLMPDRASDVSLTAGERFSLLLQGPKGPID